MSELPFFPTFFIVGAPRCSTTAMSGYLRENPSVCFSTPKEPHFFSYVCRENPDRDLEKEYLQRYFGHYDPTRHVAIGEGSVSYLYDPEAIDRILAIDPNARFIVMIRNPVEMVRSYHMRMVYLLEEDEKDFRVAWELQEPRARGERIPSGCTDPRLLQYAHVARFAQHIERLRAQSSPEQVHVTLYDDFVSQPRQVYLGVLDFIGAPDDGRSQFPRRQPSKLYRSRRLQQVLFKPPKLLTRLVDVDRIRALGSDSRLKRLRKALIRRGHITVATPALDPGMREVLRKAFADDVARLEQLLGRDLGHWG
jgi:hypothetical protein